MAKRQTVTGKKKSRVKPVRRKVRQLDWIMQWVIRMFDCSLCGKSLVDGYDKRNPGKSITLHHTEGSREEDNWEDLEYVRKMVPCHKSCHRSYHLTKRHLEDGKNANVAKLEVMEQKLQTNLKAQTAKK